MLIRITYPKFDRRIALKLYLKWRTYYSCRGRPISRCCWICTLEDVGVGGRDCSLRSSTRFSCMKLFSLQRFPFLKAWRACCACACARHDRTKLRLKMKHQGEGREMIPNGKRDGQFQWKLPGAVHRSVIHLARYPMNREVVGHKHKEYRSSTANYRFTDQISNDRSLTFDNVISQHDTWSMFMCWFRIVFQKHILRWVRAKAQLSGYIVDGCLCSQIQCVKPSGLTRFRDQVP